MVNRFSGEFSKAFSTNEEGNSGGGADDDLLYAA
jgi:hypothetical protein